MIGVRVGQQHGVELRQCVERNARRRDAREDAAQLGIEVRIGEQREAAQLDQKRGVSDVGDAHAVLTISAALPPEGPSPPLLSQPVSVLASETIAGEWQPNSVPRSTG